MAKVAAQSQSIVPTSSIDLDEPDFNLSDCKLSQHVRQAEQRRIESEAKGKLRSISRAFDDEDGSEKVAMLNLDDLKSVSHLAVSRIRSLAKDFDAGVLEKGYGPAQMLCKTSVGGFPNILVYGIDVDADVRTCHDLFSKRMFGPKPIRSKQAPEMENRLALWGLHGSLFDGRVVPG